MGTALVILGLCAIVVILYFSAKLVGPYSAEIRAEFDTDSMFDSSDSGGDGGGGGD